MSTATVPRPAARPLRGAPERVRVAHDQATPTLRLALAFLAAAVVAIPVRQWTGEWLPLHLFLAGTVVLAISGASQLLTITWSAAPPPSTPTVRAQRAAVAVGAATIGVGRAAEAPTWVVAAGGTVFVGGLVLLAAMLVTTVRRAVERRYDVPVAWYVAALTAGVAAAGFGIAMATGDTTGFRDAHVTLNLLGLVGLVIGGTFPFFVATVGRTKMSRRATPGRHARLLMWQVGALAVTAAALVSEHATIAAAGFAAYALGVVAITTLAPCPRARSLRWAGPRLVALFAGLAWWAAAVASFAVAALGDGPVVGGGWLVALVVAGYGQILWGSLAYLLPVLRGGGHERLGAGFATTRSWPAVVAINTAGVLFVAGADGVATIVLTGVAVDALARAALLSRKSADV